MKEQKKSNNNGLIIFILLIAIFCLIGSWGKIKDYVQKSLYSGNDERTKKIVAEYIIKNPDLIIKSLTEYQIKKEKEYEAEINTKIADFEVKAYNNDDFPFAGNSKGDVTLIYYFDYNCSWCKRADNSVNELLMNDKNVKVIYQEMPILSELSRKISKAALAVFTLDKKLYLKFHDGVMKKNILSEQTIDDVLKELDIEPSKIANIVNDKAIDDKLNTISQKAQELHIAGIPAFLLGNEVIKGAVDVKVLQSKIDLLRKK